MKINMPTMKRSRVEMIPLIDCMFLLLVFFIYAMMAMVVHKGIALELPKLVTTMTDQEDYISISITKEDEIYFNKERIGLDNIVSKIQIDLKDNKKANVFINADRNASHGRVLEVLDKLRSAGIYNVSFEAEMRDDES